MTLVGTPAKKILDTILTYYIRKSHDTKVKHFSGEVFTIPSRKMFCLTKVEIGIGCLTAGPFRGRYFCHSTKVPKNEGAMPLLGCVVSGGAEEVSLKHFMFVMRHV